MILFRAASSRLALIVAWTAVAAGCSVAFEDNVSGGDAGGVAGGGGGFFAAGAAGAARKATGGGGARAGAGGGAGKGSPGGGGNGGSTAGRGGGGAGSASGGAAGVPGGGASGSPITAGEAGKGGAAGSAGAKATGGNSSGSGGSAGSGKVAGSGGSAGNGLAGAAGSVTAGGGGASPSCLMGSRRCDGKLLLSCENGNYVALQNCEIACEKAACATCISGTAACVGEQVSTCIDGQAVTTPCGTGLCEEGACVECKGSASICEGNRPVACVQGARKPGVDCGGRVCSNGVCQAVCQVGDSRCVGQTLERCNDGAFEPKKVCDANETCDAKKGACQACTAGQTRCLGLELQTCVGVGLGWSTTSACTSACSSTAGCVQKVDTLVAGDGKTCVLAGPTGQQRRPFCWGSSAHGELGIFAATTAPRYLATEGPATGMAIGSEHMCFVNNGGTVKCAGNNDRGQLGSGAVGPDRAAFVAVTGLPDVANISASGHTTCAVTQDADLYCWGQLLVGTTASPQKMNGLGNATSVFRFAFSAGNHALYRADTALSGDLSAFGANHTQQLGFNTPVSPSALFPGGSVGVSGATSLAAGGRRIASGEGVGHSCAVDKDQALFCWGLDDDKQTGVSTGKKTVTVAGQSHQVVDKPALVLPNMVEVAAGPAHTCARRATGSVACWGKNPDGRAGLPLAAAATPQDITGLEGSVQRLAAGADHTCALTSVGNGATEVWCWGMNDAGQLGDASPGGGAPRRVVLSSP